MRNARHYKQLGRQQARPWREIEETGIGKNKQEGSKERRMRDQWTSETDTQTPVKGKKLSVIRDGRDKGNQSYGE